MLFDFVDLDGPADTLSAVLQWRYLHGPAVDQVLAQEDSTAETQWLLSDHLGTIHDVIDDSGAPINHIRYSAFGKLLGQTNSSHGSRFGFAGREHDPEVGLNYLRARYLDPETGRFINEDPIGFGGG